MGGEAVEDGTFFAASSRGGVVCTAAIRENRINAVDVAASNFPPPFKGATKHVYNVI